MVLLKAAKEQEGEHAGMVGKHVQEFPCEAPERREEITSMPVDKPTTSPIAHSNITYHTIRGLLVSA
jgi:hypothetical protein